MLRVVHPLEEPYARPPVVLGGRFGVDDDLVREGVGVGGGDGWNVVFVAVDDGDDLVGGLFHGLAHSATDLENICLRPGLCERHVQRPLLPTNILVCLAEEVRLSPLLLEELYRNLAPSSGLVGAVYGATESMRLLLDERLEVHIVDGGESEVEQIACEGRNRGEVSVKEDGVEYGFDDFFYARRIREDFEMVLWAPSGFHAGTCWVALAWNRENGVQRTPRCAARRLWRASFIATAWLRLEGGGSRLLPVQCCFHAWEGSAGGVRDGVVCCAEGFFFLFCGEWRSKNAEAERWAAKLTIQLWAAGLSCFCGRTTTNAWKRARHSSSRPLQQKKGLTRTKKPHPWPGPANTTTRRHDDTTSMTNPILLTLLLYCPLFSAYHAAPDSHPSQPYHHPSHSFHPFHPSNTP